MPKISSFRNPHIKIDLLPRGQAQITLATILYNESKHNILALIGRECVQVDHWGGIEVE
jgi:hypothetical protein